MRLGQAFGVRVVFAWATSRPLESWHSHCLKAVCDFGRAAAELLDGRYTEAPLQHQAVR